MDVNSATLKRNAGIIYTLILSLGAMLSSFVYFASQEVEDNTLSLIEREIPILDKLQQLDSFFTEQELYLNEYYANQNQTLYSENFLQTAAMTNGLLAQLAQEDVVDDKIQGLLDAQQEIINLARRFDINMETGDPNGDMWDIAREHLARFSELRQETKPIVSSIAMETNRRVEAQYLQTRQSLQQTNQTVLLYSFLILFIAVVVGRYFKSYLNVSAKNKRLALFPQRNPNPILSLDKGNQIAFANPATYRLLEALNLSIDSFSQALLDNVSYQQKQIMDNKQQHASFDFSLEDRTFECELHWLRDLDTWDLHLVDITQRRLAEEKLSYQAFHNTDTGLYNKNKFAQVVKSVTASPNHVAVGAMEVRHYNQLMSRFGLEQAAEIIMELANLLNRQFARHLEGLDYAFFQTSDKQFSLIIQTDFCSMQIQDLVAKIELTVENNLFCNGIHVELDFGFCCYPEHAQTDQALNRALNIALEHAIAIDHSSLVIYSNELGDAISKDIELTEKLRVAIEKQELELYYQPQLDILQDKIIGMETLIRWPTSAGFISPGEFIPLAEKSGLIIPLGEWIVESACLRAKELVDNGFDDLVVAINISPLQFRHPNFYQMLIQILKKTQVPPHVVELEITEGVIMHNETETIELLHKLKKLGFKLSIDDFGTGYSSLSYLKQFPINKLKIDQSFIFNLTDSEADQAIVQAIVDLGKNLNLTLIAEGVEQEAHLNLLKQMGCQEIQGYYFSRPLPVPSLNELLASQIKQRKSASA